LRGDAGAIRGCRGSLCPEAGLQYLRTGPRGRRRVGPAPAHRREGAGARPAGPLEPRGRGAPPLPRRPARGGRGAPRGGRRTPEPRGERLALALPGPGAPGPRSRRRGAELAREGRGLAVTAAGGALRRGEGWRLAPLEPAVGGLAPTE